MRTQVKLGKLVRRIGLAAIALGVIGAAAAGYHFRPLPVPPAPALESLSANAEHGAYLAKIANCAACHSIPGGKPFAGGVRFVTDFGTIFSSNITPGRRHGIGDWSFAEFQRAMKHGIGKQDEHLYPAFPYTSFARMSDRDIASLYVYLGTLAPVDEPERANAMTFPFGNRSLLHFWKRLFHDAATMPPSAGRGEQWNRGAYLTEAVAHCGECHTPRNRLGGADRSRPFQGGTYRDRVSEGFYRPWAAVDLTSGVHGLGGWNPADFEAYLATGQNRHAVVHGPMREVFDSLRQLTPADRAAMAAYLADLPASPQRSNLSLPSFGKDPGQVVYTVHCGTCHLPGGGGDPGLGVSLRRNPIVQASDPSSLINVILYGPELPAAPFATNRSNMKPFGRRLSDEDIAALATYLRSNFGNNAGSVSAEQVARQR